MTTAAVYTFVSKFGIPKKKEKREVFYSKKHVDVATGIATIESVNRYYRLVLKTLGQYKRSPFLTSE